MFSYRLRLRGTSQCGSVNPFSNKPWFLRICSVSLMKTLMEKEKLLVTSNFSFSHSVFYQFGVLSAIFVCKLFPVCNSLKFVVWERVSGDQTALLTDNLKSLLCRFSISAGHNVLPIVK